MSTDTTEPHADAQVIELHPQPAPGQPPVPVTAPAAVPGSRRPIVPVALQKDNRRATARHAAGLTAYRAGYHGARLPLYLLLYFWHAIRGAVILWHRLITWWRVPHLDLMVSMSVAAGRPGFHQAMSAHGEGRRTRTRRGQIIAVCAAVALAVVLAAVKWLPAWAWAAVIGIAVPVLARFGRGEGARVVRPAIVPPAYTVPDPAIITRALGSLGISGINEVIRAGSPLGFIADVHRDGDGWATELDLPHGVTAQMILQKRDSLASGLRRPLSAVWPEGVPHEHPGRVRLWIGRTDMANLPPAAWPLAKSGTVNVFDGFALGQDPRQRPITAPLVGHNWLIGAQPGQGKTSVVRVIASAVALDPLAELWTHEHSGKGDLEPYAQVSHRYVSGLDDDAIGYTAASLRLLRAELDRRSTAFAKIPRDAKPDGKITRDMAGSPPAHLYPLVCIIDEAQNVFMHEDLGEQAAADAAYVIRLGRAYGVILVLATQRPTAESLPTSVSGNVSARFCLKVPGQPENDMILGTSSYKAGYNAAAFRSETDAGMGWLKADGEPQIVRCFYIDLPAAERIARRARALRNQAGTLTGHALGLDDGDTARDILADLLTVFRGNSGLQWPEAATRLAAAFPARWADASADAVSADCRARGVPSVDVKAAGKTLKGCRRTDVQTAARP